MFRRQPQLQEDVGELVDQVQILSLGYVTVWPRRMAGNAAYTSNTTVASSPAPVSMISRLW